jgi:glucose-6-phosphate-specific signal transduction histidine kinase
MLSAWQMYRYLRRRAAASGLRFPQAFEAAITLDLAERYRLVGDVDACSAMVALAVENHPGHAGLLVFGKNFQAESPISWCDVMIPAPKELTSELAASQ